MNRCYSFPCALALLVCGFTVHAAAPPRFELSGTATLSLDASVLKSGNMQLKASLTPSGVAVMASPAAQQSGHFALVASMTASSMACYNDTIFRDGFDGDGI